MKYFPLLSKYLIACSLGLGSTLLSPLMAHAESLRGIIREVQHSSHSFNLDQPPLSRVYVNAGTKFEREGKNVDFKKIQAGDEVELDAKAMETGTFLASRVKVVKHVAEVRDLASNEINIELNQRFLMGVSQTAVLKKDGKIVFKLTTKEFINTLCKDGGYDCGGEGDLGMRVEVDKDGKKDEILLVSPQERKPLKPVVIELHGYAIQLVEVGEDVVLLVVRPAAG